MKNKYAINTFGNTKISEAIQRKLFALGYGWPEGNKKELDNLSSKWLFTYRGSGDLGFYHENHDGSPELSLRDLFCDDEILVRNTTKEMTLPEIIKELGYEVKIVK